MRKEVMMTRKNRITFRKMLLSIAVLINSYAYGNYQFEGGIPENIIVGKNSKIEISKEIVKDGEQSLKWKFKKGDKLSIKGDVGYKPFLPLEKVYILHLYKRRCRI